VTELEFIQINPNSEGTDNINVFYSSSVYLEYGTSDAALGRGQVKITGMSIPFRYIAGNVNLEQTILQASTVTFKYTSAADLTGENHISLTIAERVRKTDYFYIRFVPGVLTNTSFPGNQIQLGNQSQIIHTTVDPQYWYTKYIQNPSEIIFNPYISEKFQNSEDNPILSNATVLRKAAFVQQVDRNEDPIVPTNLAQILLNRASPAEIQNSNYTTTGIINGRYNGSKLTSGSVPGNDPALGLVNFRASIHPSGSLFTKIKGISISDRTIQKVYFSPQLSKAIAGGKNRVFSGNRSFPATPDLLYIEEGNRFVRITNSDIYSIDEDKMHTTNVIGSVIRTQS